MVTSIEIVDLNYDYERNKNRIRIDFKQKTSGGAIRRFNARRIIIDFTRVTPRD